MPPSRTLPARRVAKTSPFSPTARLRTEPTELAKVLAQKPSGNFKPPLSTSHGWGFALSANCSEPPGSEPTGEQDRRDARGDYPVFAKAHMVRVSIVRRGSASAGAVGSSKEGVRAGQSDSLAGVELFEDHDFIGLHARKEKDAVVVIENGHRRSEAVTAAGVVVTEHVFVIQAGRVDDRQGVLLDFPVDGLPEVVPGELPLLFRVEFDPPVSKRFGGGAISVLQVVVAVDEPRVGVVEIGSVFGSQLVLVGEHAIGAGEFPQQGIYLGVVSQLDFRGVTKVRHAGG